MIAQRKETEMKYPSFAVLIYFKKKKRLSIPRNIKRA
jgi:hypothetical protein